MGDVGIVEESLETLQTKLQEYRNSLDGIQEALALDPQNQELIKLKTDLEEVIVFFRDLANAKRREAGLPEATEEDTSPHCASSIGSKPEEAVDGFTPHSGDVSQGGSITEHRHQQQGIDKIVGRTCCLQTASGFLFGEILSVGDGETNNGVVPSHVRVLWFATKQKQSVPVANLRLLAPMPSELVIPGMQAQALYSDDGEWYECVVESITGEGYVVTYSGYGNTETIPVDRLRPANVPILSRRSDKKKVKEIITPAGFRIPNNLIAKPSDTEAQKADKRRKLNKLKREQKAAQAEKEAREVQSSWLTHVKKSSAKGTSRLKTALLHTKPATASS